MFGFVASNLAFLLAMLLHYQPYSFRELLTP
jgi:hypothetical protein